MTQQLSDQVLFEGAACDLVCWAGGELFDPFAHGLEPVRNCTALDRGWLAHYRVDARLWLDELMLDHAVSAPSAKNRAWAPGRRSTACRRAATASGASVTATRGSACSWISAAGC
ncbi:hypothetical protein [Lysobacter enzymogenes]|uniref:hypothetical protein n=1 Tax=Lysobacter enzymogenes TaxID=69 RepID=UPI0022654EF8|nr:hypothetical protein [Lysobacter enzymogenes]UZW63086.1 hypothetical protein BV903_012715 [Lysobacter enzymogenes]